MNTEFSIAAFDSEVAVLPGNTVLHHPGDELVYAGGVTVFVCHYKLMR